jgi:hypothetical protein
MSGNHALIRFLLAVVTMRSIVGPTEFLPYLRVDYMQFRRAETMKTTQDATSSDTIVMSGADVLSWPCLCPLNSSSKLVAVGNPFEFVNEKQRLRVVVSRWHWEYVFCTIIPQNTYPARLYGINANKDHPISFPQ